MPSHTMPPVVPVSITQFIGSGISIGIFTESYASSSDKSWETSGDRLLLERNGTIQAGTPDRECRIFSESTSHRVPSASKTMLSFRPFVVK